MDLERIFGWAVFALSVAGSLMVSLQLFAEILPNFKGKKRAESLAFGLCTAQLVIICAFWAWVVASTIPAKPYNPANPIFGM